MNKEIMDRLKAHLSRPEVYEPPTFKQLLSVIEELEADLKKMGRKSD
jgi:hypothetical protein